MRHRNNIAASFVLLAAITPSVFATSLVMPKDHWRMSPNKKFALKFVARGTTQTIFKGDRQTPLWSFQCDSAFPYDDNESDGCIFVADDGKSVAVLTYPTFSNPNATFQRSLTIYLPNGAYFEHPFDDQRIGPAHWFHALPYTLLKSIDIDDDRGDNLSRSGETIVVRGPGIVSRSYSLASGHHVSTSANWSYVGACFVAYVIPSILLIIWLRRRQPLKKGKRIRRKDVIAPYFCFGLVAALYLFIFMGFLMRQSDGWVYRAGEGVVYLGFMASGVILPAAIIVAIWTCIRLRRLETFALWFALVCTLVAKVHFDIFGGGIETDTAMLLLALVPLPVLASFARTTYRYRQQLRRMRAGFCFECGYDLRESEMSCPECGTPIKATVAATSPS